MLLYYFLTSVLIQKPVLFGPVPCVFWFPEIGSVFRTWSWALRWHLIGRVLVGSVDLVQCFGLYPGHDVPGSGPGLVCCDLCWSAWYVYISICHCLGIGLVSSAMSSGPGIWSRAYDPVLRLWSRAEVWLWSWLTAHGSCARLTAACLCLRLTAAIRYDCVAAKRSV